MLDECHSCAIAPNLHNQEKRSQCHRLCDDRPIILKLKDYGFNIERLSRLKDALGR